jgi:hypothetical protein
VEQLSGKPLELRSALHRGQGSWQAGGYGCLSPGWCLSQGSKAPVIPHGAGARQGLMGEVGSGHPTRGWGSAGLKGSGLGGKGGYPSKPVGPAPGWGPVQTGGGDPGGHGSGGMTKGWVFQCGVVWGWRLVQLRDRYPAVCGSGKSCGLAQPEGQRAWQKRAVALQTYRAGIWLASCSFIRSWCGEAFQDLSL